MDSLGIRGRILSVSLLVGAVVAPVAATHPGDGDLFRRIASFPVFLNTQEDVETLAEIVAAADNGNLLVYTDSATGNIGFVDISDPANPSAGGVVDVGGSPTSVAVKGSYALACVNTSVDFVNTSGDLQVVDVHSRTIVRTIPLGGQPDSIAVSPDGRFAAICIENERDEDLGNGEPPQAPPGFVVIVDLVGPPANWTTRVVELVGVPDLFPEDPEPEFVDINAFNVAAVTCQENNHIVLIWLPNGHIIDDFPAGTVDLTHVDTQENDLIEQVDDLDDVAREPDGIAWTSLYTLATADEGDLFGGSRGFTTWLSWGVPLFQPNNKLEHLVARIGHYPEGRSENKGNETESVEFAKYGQDRFLFAGSERSNVVFVYQLFPAPLIGNLFPILRQVLPTGSGPEGLLAIPQRNLFVVANEVDDRGGKIRSTIMIYELGSEATYPTVYSANRDDSGIPIPWGALSGLVADANEPDTVHTIHDSFYRKSRIYTLDIHDAPAIITDELPLNDSNGVLIDALNALKARLPGTDDFDPADAINDDGTVNLDLEGIDVLAGGSFVVASEGAGNLDNGVSNPANRPFTSPNILAKVSPGGTIQQVALLPLDLIQNQFRFGFEGVAVAGGKVYVCFQRAWTGAGDPSNRTRIGRYDPNTQEWTFVHYPLDAPTSPNGGWVGLSELTYLGGQQFAVIERDDQGGPDARIKRIYSFSIAGVDFKDNTEVRNFELLEKELAIDLLEADTYGPTGGPIPEKLEGLAVLADGSALIVNDNDGVDDNNGETQLIRIEDLFD